MFGGGAPKPAVSDDEEADEQDTRLHHQHNHSSDEQKITQSSLSLNAPSVLVDTIQAQWIRLAKVIDRAAFVVFTLFYITMGALKYISVWERERERVSTVGVDGIILSSLLHSILKLSFNPILLKYVKHPPYNPEQNEKNDIRLGHGQMMDVDEQARCCRSCWLH